MHIVNSEKSVGSSEEIRLGPNVPFARKGSYMTLGQLPEGRGPNGLLLRTMHRVELRECFSIELRRGDARIDYDTHASPALCTLASREGEEGHVKICLPETDVARVVGTGGIKLRLVSVHKGKGIYAFPTGDRSCIANLPRSGVRYRVVVLRGSLEIDSPVGVGDPEVKAKMLEDPQPIALQVNPDADGRVEFVVQEYMMTPPEIRTLERSFEECVEFAREHWRRWLDSSPQVAEGYGEAAAHAMHVNYSATVGAWGFLKRQTMLMSRNWMTQCWSWDHCFNAIALAESSPGLAWDQLNVHFDLQEAGGCLPDGVNAERCTWNFCKPPIHGWTLARMGELNGELLSLPRLEEFYPKLARWTEWWFNTRDLDGDGLPEYQHGNDSGWDNSSAFDVGFPCCSPDLQGHLATQMDQLATMARLLGYDSEAKRWGERRDAHVAKTVERLWDDDTGQFRAFRAFTGEREAVGNSLINHLIVVMGDLLPQPYRDRVAAKLEPDGEFVTPYGPATESPKVRSTFQAAIGGDRFGHPRRFSWWTGLIGAATWSKRSRSLGATATCAGRA